VPRSNQSPRQPSRRRSPKSLSNPPKKFPSGISQANQKEQITPNQPKKRTPRQPRRNRKAGEQIHPAAFKPDLQTSGPALAVPDLNTPFSTERDSLAPDDLEYKPIDRSIPPSPPPEPQPNMSIQAPHNTLLIPGPIEFDDAVLQSMSHYA